MGNSRSKSASVPRSKSDKYKFLFQQKESQIGHGSLSFHIKDPFQEIKRHDIKTTIPQTERKSQFIKEKPYISNKEIQETLIGCKEISEISLYSITNVGLLQYSSLISHKDKTTLMAKEAKYFSNFSIEKKEIPFKSFVEKTPKSRKNAKEILNEKSINELDPRKINQIGSFLKEGTPKIQNHKDTSSPNEDGSTPHFDKKFGYFLIIVLKNILGQIFHKIHKQNSRFHKPFQKARKITKIYQLKLNYSQQKKITQL